MAALSVAIGVFTLIKFVAHVDSITAYHYWQYGVYAQPLNCQGVSGRRTFLHCAVNCVRGCQAFRYDNGCRICSSGQASSLTFTSDSYYLPRSHRVSGSPGSGVSIQLSQPLSVGNMIHISLTMLSTSTGFNFYSYRPNTIFFHFLVRPEDGNIVMNTMNSGTWGGEQLRPFRPYFGQGLKTDIHMLVGKDRFIIYLNRNYCCSYMYRLSIAEVRSLSAGGNVHVHELSV